MPEIPQLSAKVQEVVRAAIAAEMFDHRYAGDCDKGIRGLPVDTKLTLKVLSSASQAIGQVVNHKGFQGLSWLIDQFEKWAPAPKKPDPLAFNGTTTNQIHGQLVFALSELGSTYIYEQEHRLQGTARGASGSIVDRKNAYDLGTPSDFLSSPRNEYFANEDLFLRTKNLREIAGVAARVGGVLDDLRDELSSILGRDHWRRETGLGVDVHGHYSEFEDLHRDTTNVMGRSSRALDELAERMVKVSYDFERTDEQIEGDMGRIRKEVLDPTPLDDHRQFGY